MLRRLDPDDLVAFRSYRNDAEIGRYQGWSPLSDEDALAFLSEMSVTPFGVAGEWIQIGIAEPPTGKLVGDIGVCIDSDGRSAEIGFSLARGAQGQGLATAAVREAIRLIFALSEADQIRAVTDARNAACLRLLERLGMHRIETRQVQFRGECCTEHVYILPRPDA